MWDIKFIYIACNLIILPFGVRCTQSVPVYLWETLQSSNTVPALTSLDQDEFREIIADKSSTDNPVFVFAEETLSPEDFALRNAKGKPIFASISSLKESANITYWPLVKNPIMAVTQLLNKNVVSTSIKELLDNPTFSVHSNDILIIDLKDAIDGENRLEMLKRHDKDIIKLYGRYAKSNKNIIGILTSYSSSWVLSDELRSARRPRDVENAQATKEDDNKNPEESNKRYSNKNLLMYVNSTAKLYFEGSSVTLDDFAFEPENQLDLETMNSTMKSKTNKDIALTFNFQFGGGYWSLTNISVTNNTNAYYLWIRDVYAPLGFSYHCHAQNFRNMSNPNVNLTLPGFQLQVYLNASETTVYKFGDAYDCVGFTSAPIWSGLFVTFIMVLIMTFGLSMMMDIKTMDRFDDPKGKTITISATE